MCELFACHCVAALKLAAMHKKRGVDTDEMVVPNDASGDDGLVLRSAQCSRAVSQSSTGCAWRGPAGGDCPPLYSFNCGWPTSSRTMSAVIPKRQLYDRAAAPRLLRDLRPRKLPRSADNEKRQLRRPRGLVFMQTSPVISFCVTPILSLLQERLVVRRERREAFQPARKQNRPCAVSGTSGLNCRMVSLSEC